MGYSFRVTPIQKPEVSIDIDTLTPFTGTLDMDNLTSILRKPLCPLDVPTLNPDSYIVLDDFSREFEELNQLGLEDGALRTIECAPGYEPAEFNSGPSPQLLKCDRGRWAAANLIEPFLLCEKPCSDYEEVDLDIDILSMTVIKEGTNRHMSRRKLLCNAGYESPNIMKGYEILHCRSGTWDRRTIECIRKDITSQIYQKAECGNAKIMNLLDNPDKYSIKEIISRTYVENMSNENNKKVATYVGVWNLKCARGYTSDIASLPLICINTTLYTTLHNNRYLEVSNTDLFANSTNIFNFNEGEDIIEINYGETFQLLKCNLDIREPPHISPSQPGISNSAFYVLVFAGCCGILALGMLALYLKKTHCCTKPFFNDHHHKIGNDDDFEDKKKFPVKSEDPKLLYGDTNSFLNSNISPQPLITPKSLNTRKFENKNQTVYRDLNKIDDNNNNNNDEDDDNKSSVGANFHSVDKTFYRPKPNKTLIKLAAKNPSKLPNANNFAFTYERNMNNDYSGTESSQSAFYYSELDIDHEKLKQFWQNNAVLNNGFNKKLI